MKANIADIFNYSRLNHYQNFIMKHSCLGIKIENYIHIIYILMCKFMTM